LIDAFEAIYLVFVGVINDFGVVAGLLVAFFMRKVGVFLRAGIWVLDCLSLRIVRRSNIETKSSERRSGSRLVGFGLGAAFLAIYI